MAIALHSTTKGSALASKDMVVSCLATMPVGAVMTLGIVVHGRNDVTTQHTYRTGIAVGDTLNGWVLYQLQDNWVDNDYFQTWGFVRAKVEGDETWLFTSVTQLNPARAWALLAWTGCSAVPAPVAKANSLTNVSGHKFTSLAMPAAGDVFLGFTSRQRSQMSAQPALTFAVESSKGGSGEADPASISAWYKTVAAAGATGDFAYTASPANDYSSISLALVGATGPQTVGDGDGVGFGRIVVPGFAGLPRLAHSLDAEIAAFDAAMLDEQNAPVLLATVSPLNSDAPSGVLVEEKFSSGWYAHEYMPAIEKWPEIDRSLYAEQKVGGRVGLTVGALELLNDRESVPGDKYGTRLIVPAQLNATASGEVVRPPESLAATFEAQLDATASGALLQYGGTFSLEFESISAGEANLFTPYPALLGSTSGQSRATTQHTITLPAHAAGDMIVVMACQAGLGGGNTLAPSAAGWTQVVNSVWVVGGNYNSTAIYKVYCTGSSHTLRLDSASNSHVVWCAYAFDASTFWPGNDGVTANAQINTAANGTSTSPNGTVNSGQIITNLVLNVAGWADGTKTWSADPSGYSLYPETETDSGTAGMGIQVVGKECAAGTEDPGAGTLSGSSLWRVYTVTIAADWG